MMKEMLWMLSELWMGRMDGVWSFLTKIREVVEVVVVVVVVLRTPSAMSVESLVILRGSVAVVVEEAMGGVEALALAVVGVLIMHMDAGASALVEEGLLLQGVAV